MPVVERSAIVPFTSTQMYDLVNDIKQYPAFLPWCQQVQVLNTQTEIIEAAVTVSKGPWQKSFTTKNHLTANQSIHMELVNGPFRFLQGLWHFEGIDVDKTQVRFKLSFEFNHVMLSLTVGPMIQHIASTLVQAFIDRAHQIYVLEPTS